MILKGEEKNCESNEKGDLERKGRFTNETTKTMIEKKVREID